jgi:hypothetical protein
LLLSSFLGSANGSEEQGTAITLDSSLNIYVAGRATARTFPVILGSFQRTYGGGSSDAFVTKVQNLCATNTQNRTVFICSPGGTVTTSPMRIVAETTDTLPVTLIQLYVDGKQVAAYHLTSIEAFVLAAPGPHRITVIATDAIGTFRETITIDVQ